MASRLAVDGYKLLRLGTPEPTLVPSTTSRTPLGPLRELVTIRPVTALEAGSYSVHDSAGRVLAFGVAGPADVEAPSAPWTSIIGTTRWYPACEAPEGLVKASFRRTDGAEVGGYLRVEVNGALDTVLAPDADTVSLGAWLCGGAARVRAKPGATIRVRVTAVDVAGNESPPTEFDIVAP